jgi:hypothetical protein
MAQQLTDVGKQKLNNITLIIGGFGLLGGIGGVIYSRRTGGGFWRGVGYYFVGSLALGLPLRLALTPAINKVMSEETINVNNTADIRKHSQNVAQSLADSGGYQ